MSGTSANNPDSPTYAEFCVSAYSWTGTAKIVRLPPMTVTMPASHNRRKSGVRSGVVSAKNRRTTAEAARCGSYPMSPARR